MAHSTVAVVRRTRELTNLQFTINGLLEPVLHAKPGQTEIWVLANVSDIAYMPVQLTETATGNHPKIAIVGQKRECVSPSTTLPSARSLSAM